MKVKVVAIVLASCIVSGIAVFYAMRSSGKEPVAIKKSSLQKDASFWRGLSYDQKLDLVEFCKELVLGDQEPNTEAYSTLYNTPSRDYIKQIDKDLAKSRNVPIASSCQNSAVVFLGGQSLFGSGLSFPAPR